MTFPGFSKQLIQFFRELEKNNNREWFQANKAVFDDAVRGPMLTLVEAFNKQITGIAPDYVTDPKKAVYRIYRDTRFSADKTPYKTHIGALFTHRALTKETSSGFYFACSAKTVEVAGGFYMPMPPELLLLRNRIAEAHTEFTKLYSGRRFKALLGELHGNQVSRMPKGFAKDHPAGDLLRRKQWYWYVELDPQLATTPKLLPELTRRFELLAPILDFMNAPMLERQKKERQRKEFAR